MSTNSLVFTVITIAAALTLIIFLVRRNRRDIKYMNPEQDDTIEEVKGDQERRREEM